MGEPQGCHCKLLPGERVHCQGELEVQHFAGLQQYLGYSVLCSGLGCNDMESPT